jgi:TetR/AcrR family transcriptional repressor of nem operon
VPKGSFYNHFESKEALGAEVVDRYGRDNPRRAALADTSVPASMIFWRTLGLAMTILV